MKLILFSFTTGIPNPVDLVIAVDSTNEISSDQLKHVKRVLKALLTSYNISATETNVAVLRYGQNVEEVLPLKDGVRMDIIEKHIDSIAPTLEGPRSASGPLAAARRRLINDARVNRRMKPSSQILLVMMGDNSDTDDYRMKAIASQLEKDKIHLIMLAISLKNLPVLSIAVNNKSDIINVVNARKLKETLGELEMQSGQATGISNDIEDELTTINQAGIVRQYV